MMQLDEQGFVKQRRLPDKRLLAVELLTYNRAKLGIGLHPPLEDAPEFRDQWEFLTLSNVLTAFLTWNPDETPEPDGWNRHPATGRYRINGDKHLEYVKWDGSFNEQVAHAIRVTQGQERVVREIKLREAAIEDYFPTGTTCHIVRSIDTSCMHSPMCEWYDKVFHYLDRCVVLSMSDMFSVSMPTLLRRLQE